MRRSLFYSHQLESHLINEPEPKENNLLEKFLKDTEKPNLYRSSLEQTIAIWLSENEWHYFYEPFPIAYEQSDLQKNYTADFLLSNGVIIEAKGRFFEGDAEKHLAIREQHPDLDLRFVFSNAHQRISKTSTETYADWCGNAGFSYCQNIPPIEWLEEPPEKKRLAALAQFILSEQDRGRIIGFNAWPKS